MYQLPVLPQGYVAQPVWLRDSRDHCLEFAYVYDPAGRLDRRRCYWMATARGAGEAATVRHATWGRLREVLARGAPSFAAFSSFEAPLESIEDWIRVAGSELPAHPTPTGGANAGPAAAPWLYLGLRRAGGRWVRVSGYVPSE